MIVVKGRGRVGREKTKYEDGERTHFDNIITKRNLRGHNHDTISREN